MFKRIIALFLCIILFSCGLIFNTSAQECVHQMDSFGIDYDLACISPFMKFDYCLNCDYMEFIESPPLGHNYSENNLCTCCSAVLGDINLDKNVNILDLIKLKEYLLDLPEYSYIYDVDFDNNLNASDMIVIRKMLFAEF